MSENHHEDDKTQTYIPLLRDTAVGHYRVVEKIGAGGMGEVYLAEDTELDRKVALKFLPNHLCQDEDCRARFRREAQAAARLSHPNIITVFEVSEYKGRPFFAMEHVEGRSLKEFSSDKDLSIEQILELAIQICDGLHAAHEKGITHRDIKPSNILIDSHGRARIVDFGLASVVGKDQLTKTGSTLGTIGYMSPEQVRGQEIDHRTDLFSLGVVLYELITKHNPFKRDSEAATLKAVSDDLPDPLSRFKSGLPDGLQAIIDKALEKDVKIRYQHADGILSDLMRLRQGSSVTLAPGASLTTSRRWLRVVLPMALVILAITVLVLKPWKLHTSPSQKADAAEKRLAILYFDNLVDQSDSLKLGEIITNLLIADLGNSDYLQVVSRQRLDDILAMMGFETGKTVSSSVTTEIARRTDASQILCGSILRTEPTIVVTYQIINVTNGDVISSGKVNGDKDQTIFDVTDQLTVAVKGRLQLPDSALVENDPPVSQITSNSTEAYRFYLEGLRQYNELKYDSASISFNKAISIDSNFVMAYYHLSIVAGSRNAKMKALESAHDRLDRASKREKILVQAMYAEYIERDFDSSRKLLESLLKRSPDDKWVTFWLGILYYEQYHNLDMSKHYFHETIKLDSNYKLGYAQLVYLYSTQGLVDSALWAFNEYVKRAPDEFNSYDIRGDLYRFSGDLPNAVASYEKALQINPSFGPSRQKLADVHLFLGDLEEADSLNLELATSGSKLERVQNRLRLTLTLESRGKIKEALEKIDLLIETDKVEKGSRGWVLEKIFKKALLYDILDETDSSVIVIESAYNGAIARLGFDMQAWLAYYYYRTGNIVKADEIRSRLTAIHDSILYLGQTVARETALLGFVAYSRGAYSEALDLFEKAEKEKVILRVDDYRWFPLEYFHALTLYSMGKLGDAVEKFRAVLTCYDIDRSYNITRAVLTHYWLGRAYEESGWNEQAIEQFERFRDIWKDADPGIKEIDDAQKRLAHLKSLS